MRCADQYVDATRLHIDPDGTGGDAIEYEQTTYFVNSIGYGAQIIVGQDNASCGLYVGSEDQVRLVGADFGDHIFNGGGGKLGLSAGVGLARLEHRFAGRDATHFENLTPTVAEPAVADNQALFVLRKLPCHSFHAEGATAGNDGNGIGVVDVFERGGNVAHHLLERL